MKQTALITGASSGIGRELAKTFALKGYNLVLVARNKETLEQVAGELKTNTQVTIISKDLSKPNSPKELFTELQKQNIEIDVLVNNAGFGNYGYFATTDYNADEELINLNILALTQLTKLFLPKMLESKAGKILNVASVAGFMPGPYMNTYFASKSYVLNFSLALQNELKASGVSVTCLCPGPTPTNFGKRAHYEFSLKRHHYTAVEHVANCAYKGLLKGKSIVIPGLQNKLIAFFAQIIPKKSITNIVRVLSGF